MKQYHKYMNNSSLIRFIKGTLLALLLFLPSLAHAEDVAWVECSWDSNKELTLIFHYDGNYRQTNIDTFIIPEYSSEQSTPGWAGTWGTKVKYVVFNSSFANYRPTSCHNWFYNMTNLKSIEGIEYLNTEEVKDMSGMFNRCKVLNSVDVSNFNTEKVVNMAYMFELCECLAVPDLSHFNTENVTDMSEMFAYNRGWSSIDVSSFKTPKVTNMYRMFYLCNSLGSLDLTGFDTRNVTNTSQMFWTDSHNFIAINVSDAFVLPESCIADRMFGCFDIYRYEYGKEEAIYDSEGGLLVKAEEEAWAEYDGSTKTLTLHYDNTRKATVATATYLFPDGSEASGTEPGWKEYADEIEKVKIDNQFAMYSVGSCAGLFSGLGNLKSIEGLRYLRTSAVADMSQMFEGCASLSSIDMSGLDVNAVTNASQMFKDCSSLESIYIDDNFVLTSTCDGTDMFAGCTSLPWYNADKVGAEKAKSFSTGGYLINIDTDKVRAVYDADTKTLTLRYDTNKGSTEGTPTWHTYKDDVTKICFDSSFAEYQPTTCSNWFAGMANLEKIDSIEHLNTTAVTDMSEMFKDCQKLTAVDLTGFDVSKVTSADGMFSGCTSLKSIYVSGTFALPSGCDGTDMFDGCNSLPDFDAASTDAVKAVCREDGGYLLHVGNEAEPWVEYNSDTRTLAFHYDNKKAACLSTVACSLPTVADKTYGWYDYRAEIERVVFDPAFANARPTTCNGWFYEMTKIKDIEGLKYLNTSEVTGMKAMFAYCAGLTYLDLSTFNTGKVTGADGMRGMFAGCSGLTSLNLSGFNTENVTDMELMFYGCASLNYLDLTDFNTANVSNMTQMFYGDTSLNAIVVTDKFTTTNATGTEMFRDCAKLENYAADSYGIEKAKYTTDGGCLSNATNVNTEAWVEYDSASQTLTFHYDKLKNIVNATKKFVFSRYGNPDWTINTYADSIKRVVFNREFAAARPASCAYWFSGFISLASIEGLEYLNTSEADNMLYMFYNCRLLTSLDLSGFNTEKVISTTGMFRGCQKLTNLDLSSFNTSAVESMNYMFLGCSALATVDLSSFDTSLVTDMSDMFAGCNALKTLDLTSFDVAKVTKASSMFLDCGSLDNIYVKDKFALSEACTGDNMFSGCSKLAHYDGTDVGKDKAVCIGDGGYLTNIASRPWVAYDADNKTLTFYHNDQRDYSAATATYPLNSDCTPTWSATKENITKVAFDSSFADVAVTSCKDWFSDMTALTDVEGLEYLNTENVTDMQGMFQNCTALTELDLTALNTSAVETMASMFGGCSQLATITVSDHFRLSADCYAADMFSGCEKLTGYDSASVGKEKATYIDDGGYLTGYDKEGWVEYQESTNSLTFHYDRLKQLTEATAKYALNPYKRNPEWLGMTNIEHVSINPAFADARPTGCYRWFFNMSKLNGIDGIEYVNTSDAVIMEEMFYGCRGITSLDLSEFSTGKVKSMDGMFRLCSSLDTIYVSDSFVANGSGDNMFGGCEKLYNYNASNVGKEMAKYIADGGYFTKYNLFGWAEYTADDKTLTFRYDKKYDISANKKYTLPTSKDDALWTDRSEGIRDNITKVVFNAEFANAKPTICYKWFADMKNLAAITGIEYLNTAEVTDMHLMFKGCTALKSLDLSTFETGNVTDMGNMFQGCTALTSLKLAGLNAGNVTDMSRMFQNCTALTALDLSGLNAGKVTDMSLMFNGCSSLATLDMSGFTAPEVTTTNSMFKDCKALTAVSMANFNSAKLTDMGSMFAGCNELATLDLSGLVTSSVTTMNSLFQNCTALTALDLSGFNTEKVTDMAYMFYYCKNLQNIDLSPLNTANVTTMANMFAGCSSLTKLDVSPLNTANVTTMDYMFRSCEGLTSLDLSTFDTGNLTSMGYMFQWSAALKEIDLSGFDTRKVNNMAALFQMGDNGKLEKIYVGENFIVADDCSTTDIFKNCPSLPDYDTKGTGAENANYTDGYFTLRRHFTVGDTRYNADGVDAVCYDDVAFGDKDEFVTPCNFTMDAACEATYGRDVTSNWATLCLPFTFSAADNTSAKFYEIENISETLITVKELTDTVTAGKSVLVYTDNGTVSVKGYTGTRVVSAPLADANFIGTFTTEAVDNSPSNYIISKNKFWNVASLLDKSGATSVKMSPYRAYISTGTSGAKGVSLDIVADETDNINGIDADGIANLLDGAELYDLQGRRLDAPSKGVMIVKKGSLMRKVMIR